MIFYLQNFKKELPKMENLKEKTIFSSENDFYLRIDELLSEILSSPNIFEENLEDLFVLREHIYENSTSLDEETLKKVLDFLNLFQDKKKNFYLFAIPFKRLHGKYEITCRIWGDMNIHSRCQSILNIFEFCVNQKDLISGNSFSKMREVMKRKFFELLSDIDDMNLIEEKIKIENFGRELGYL